MGRAFGELMGLECEAERLVRMGESRAEVSRRLGVHPQTLAGWALRGGWRKKDLELERHQEIARATIRAIRSGNAQVDARNAARAQLKSFMQEAVRLLAAGDERSMEELSRRLGGVESHKALEAPKVELAVDPMVAGMRGLGASPLGDAGGEPEPMVDENGVAWTAERLRAHNRGERDW